MAGHAFVRCRVELSEFEPLWVGTIVSQAVASQAIAAQTIIDWAVKGTALMRKEVVTDREYLIIPQVICNWIS